jgi:hypothetical protein
MPCDHRQVWHPRRTPEKMLRRPSILQTGSRETLSVLKEALVVTLRQSVRRIWLFFSKTTDEFIFRLGILRAYDAAVDLKHYALRIHDEEMSLWHRRVRVVTAHCWRDPGRRRTAKWDHNRRLPTKEWTGPGLWINLYERHLSGGRSIARSGITPVEMALLEDPSTRSVLTARKSNGSKGAGRYELSLFQPWMAETVPPCGRNN